MVNPASKDKIAANINANFKSIPAVIPANTAPNAAKPSPTDEIHPSTVDSRWTSFSKAIAIMIERTANIRIPVIIRSGNMVKSLDTKVMNQAQTPPPVSPPIAMVFLPTLSEM